LKRNYIDSMRFISAGKDFQRETGGRVDTFERPGWARHHLTTLKRRIGMRIAARPKRSHRRKKNLRKRSHVPSRVIGLSGEKKRQNHKKQSLGSGKGKGWRQPLFRAGGRFTNRARRNSGKIVGLVLSEQGYAPERTTIGKKWGGEYGPKRGSSS